MAISEREDKFEIDPYICTECVGYSGKPQCLEGCPVGAILPNPDFMETQQELEAKYILIKELTTLDA
jgi:ferredoxin